MVEFDGIKIQGPDDDFSYAGNVVRVLESIKGNRAGAVLIRLIGSNRRDLTIVPYTAADMQDHGFCNAITEADNERDATPEGINPYLGRDDDPRTPEDERYQQERQGFRGTGDGSDVHVHFTPDLFNGSSCGNGLYGSQPDEILFHEMIHALRKMEGRLNPYPTEGSLRGYENEEEWLAIVATNIYMSAKYVGRNANNRLRADHEGRYPLKPPLNTSAGFLTDPNNLRLLNIYKLLDQPLFNLLAMVPAPFNPFNELVTTGRH